MGIRNIFSGKPDPNAYVDPRSKAPSVPDHDWGRIGVGLATGTVGVLAFSVAVGYGMSIHASKTISPSEICHDSYVGAQIACWRGIGQPK